MQSEGNEENGVGDDKLDDIWSEEGAEIPNGSESTVDAAAKHRCEICSKGFSIPARLTRHYRTHSGEKPWSCDICGKSFAVKENLSVHLRVHTKERPYRCETCGRAFEHSGKLHRHRRIHTGERPHQCPICGKDFIQSGQLVIHQRSHTGEKPFVCRTCDKGFTCSKQLKVHQRTHTGEKPYSCKICNKSFGYNHVLKFHLMSHYGSKYYKCKNCSAESFSTLQKLKQHLKNCRPNDETPSTSRDSHTATESEEEKTSSSCKSFLEGKNELSSEKNDQIFDLSDSALDQAVNLSSLTLTTPSNRNFGIVEDGRRSRTVDHIARSFNLFCHSLAPPHVPDPAKVAVKPSKAAIWGSKSEGTSPEPSGRLPLERTTSPPFQCISVTPSLMGGLREGSMPAHRQLAPIADPISPNLKNVSSMPIGWDSVSQSSSYAYHRVNYKARESPTIVRKCSPIPEFKNGQPTSTCRASPSVIQENASSFKIDLTDFSPPSVSSTDHVTIFPVSPSGRNSASSSPISPSPSSYLIGYHSTTGSTVPRASPTLTQSEDWKRIPFRKRSFAFMDSSSNDGSSTEISANRNYDLTRESPNLESPRSQSVIKFARRRNDSVDS